MTTYLKKNTLFKLKTPQIKSATLHSPYIVVLAHAQDFTFFNVIHTRTGSDCWQEPSQEYTAFIKTWLSASDVQPSQKVKKRFLLCKQNTSYIYTFKTYAEFICAVIQL